MLSFDQNLLNFLSSCPESEGFVKNVLKKRF